MTDEKTGRRRVLLKLSGEAFGAGSLGVNPDVIGTIAKEIAVAAREVEIAICLLYTSPSPRDKRQSRMPSSA